MNKTCPECGNNLRKVNVSIYGAKNKALSYQCPKCDHFEFEQETSKKIIEELQNNALKIRHKIVKLSGERMGIYFNNNIVRSLNLKKGDYLYVSVPDKKRILLELAGATN